MTHREDPAPTWLPEGLVLSSLSHHHPLKNVLKNNLEDIFVCISWHVLHVIISDYIMENKLISQKDDFHCLHFSRCKSVLHIVIPWLIHSCTRLNLWTLWISCLYSTQINFMPYVEVYCLYQAFDAWMLHKFCVCIGHEVLLISDVKTSPGCWSKSSSHSFRVISWSYVDQGLFLGKL